MVEGRMEEIEDTDEGSWVEIDLILDVATLEGIKLGCNGVGFKLSFKEMLLLLFVLNMKKHMVFSE